jgi:hypothetical protein
MRLESIWTIFLLELVRDSALLIDWFYKVCYDIDLKLVHDWFSRQNFTFC